MENNAFIAAVESMSNLTNRNRQYIVLFVVSLVAISCAGETRLSERAWYDSVLASKYEQMPFVARKDTAAIKRRFRNWVCCYTPYSIRIDNEFVVESSPSPDSPVATFELKLLEDWSRNDSIQILVKSPGEFTKEMAAYQLYVMFGIVPPSGHPMHRECIDTVCVVL